MLEKLVRKILAASALAALVAACGNDNRDGILVGAIIDQSGTTAETSWVQAIQLATAQMNEALDAEGYPVHFLLRVADSENTPATATLRANELVGDGARALITDTTQVTEAVAREMYGPSATFNVLVQCSSCSSASFLDGSYVNAADPVLQSIRNNTQKNLARTVVSSRYEAYAILDLLRRQGIDQSPDGTVKLAFYGSNETEGLSATQDLYDVASEMFASFGTPNTTTTATRLYLERVLHDATLGANQVDYVADVARLSDYSTTTPEGQTFTDGHAPDYIVVATFAQNAAGFQQSYYSLFSPGLAPVFYQRSFRQSNTLYQLGATVLNRSQGVSPLITANTVSGARFATDFADTGGFAPHYGDAQYYDNAVSIMLATLIAGRTLPDPQSVAPAAIAASLPLTSVSNATTVSAGVNGFRTAIAAIRSGTDINYDGASGPMDYDSLNNVSNRLTHFRYSEGEFVDQEGGAYDCVSSASPTCGVSVP